MWISTVLGIAVLVFYMARILLVTRSTVAMWYSASLGIALFASLYEVIAAALGVKALIGTINSVTAALASSLMAALAIAEQMRQERLGRVKAQTELRSTYEAIPIGLFTLDAHGVFLRGNPALASMLGVDLSRAKNETWTEHFEPGAWARLRGHGPAQDRRRAGNTRLGRRRGEVQTLPGQGDAGRRHDRRFAAGHYPTLQGDGQTALPGGERSADRGAEPAWHRGGVRRRRCAASPKASRWRSPTSTWTGSS